jgi:hypothetical protein
MATKKKNPPKTTPGKAGETPNSAKTAAAPPAPASTKTQAARSPAIRANEKLSALDAAARVLSETGKALTCPELIAAMAAQGYWTSPAGKTPQTTLHAAIAKEIRTKKNQARFRKIGPGRFALA